MNRIDRLFNILLILQRRKLVRAADLAREFEVSSRTIYRDLDALSEMGVPLIAMPGEGYALVEGFYMPPLAFTSDEAKALFLGARMLAGQAAGELAKSAAAATEKIALVLPEESRRDVQQLMDIIHFFLPPEKFDLDQPHLRQLQRAIQGRQLVNICYHSYNQNALTERVIEPHFLTYSDGAWYVSAYCRLRRDTRSFRLERIERLDVLRDTFTPRDLPDSPPETVIVRVRFAADVVRWVRERQHYAYQGDDGDAVMIYRMHNTSEIKAWVMGWGAQAEVLSPPDFRAEIREEARKILSLLT